MDIAGLSIGLSQVKLAQEVGLAVTKVAMDSAKLQADDMVKMLDTNIKGIEESAKSHLGRNVDIRL